MGIGPELFDVRCEFSLKTKFGENAIGGFVWVEVVVGVRL
jgi:hypothetical protein